MKNHSKRFLGAVLALGTVHSSALFANGTRLDSQDTFAIARGYAFAATADNPSAIYYNPAGLSTLNSATISSGAYGFKMDLDYVNTSGVKTDEQSGAFVLPTFFAGIPLGKNFTAGIGFYSPFGLSSDWPTTSGFSTYTTKNEVNYYTGELALSYKIAPGLSFAAGVLLNQNKTKLAQQVALAPGFLVPFGFKGDDTAASFSLGMLWQINPMNSIGLTYKSKTDFNLKGTATLGSIASESGSGHWVYPESAAIGYSFKPIPALNLEVDYNYTNWSRLNSVTLLAGQLSTVVPFNWKSSAYWCFGGTYYLSNGWNISAGYCYSENSVPDNAFSPSLADMNRKLFNIGPAFKFDHWQIDTAFQYSPRETRSIATSSANSAGENFNGTYRSRIIGASATLTYHF